MTFRDAAVYYSDSHYPLSGSNPHSTVAKNGKWLAYKLFDRDTKYENYLRSIYPHMKERTDDERIAGWFICHEDVADPVDELCQMIDYTFTEENGGSYDYQDGTSNNTHPVHVEMGYILIARYAMGYNVPPNLTEEQEEAIRDEGLFVVDWEDAKKEDMTVWKERGVCNIHTYGDFDIGRLKYNDEDLCEAFLLTGSAAPFQHIHFTVDGTAPLGIDYEDSEEEDPPHQGEGSSEEDPE